MKIYVWNLAGEGTENTWQKVGGRNGGNSQVNDLFILSGELFYNVAAHVQHIGGAVIEQKTALGDVQLLGGADQQPRVQFLLVGWVRFSWRAASEKLLFSTTATKASNCLNSIG